MPLSSGKKFALGVLVVFLLSGLLGVPLRGIFLLFPILLVLAMLFFAIEHLRKRGSGGKGIFRVLTGGSEFLCDDCKWNYGTACVRQERPNATKCPDFKKK